MPTPPSVPSGPPARAVAIRAVPSLPLCVSQHHRCPPFGSRGAPCLDLVPSAMQLPVGVGPLALSHLSLSPSRSRRGWGASLVLPHSGAGSRARIGCGRAPLAALPRNGGLDDDGDDRSRGKWAQRLFRVETGNFPFIPATLHNHSHYSDGDYRVVSLFNLFVRLSARYFVRSFVRWSVTICLLECALSNMHYSPPFKTCAFLDTI